MKNRIATLNHNRIGKLSFILSTLSVISFAAGFQLFVDKGLDYLPTACWEKRLMFVAAPLLAVAALASRFKAGRVEGAARRLQISSRVLAVAVLLLAGLLTLPPWMLPLRMDCAQPSGESMAINVLRDLNNAISVHVTLHHELPNPTEEQWILREIEYRYRSRGWKPVYTIVYTPLPNEAGETRKQYTLLARPVQFGKTGRQNFFTDETEVIRFTLQDRAATASDCKVEDWETCRP